MSLYQAIKGMGGWLSRLIFDYHQDQPHVYSVHAACRTNPIHLISGVQNGRQFLIQKGLDADVPQGSTKKRWATWHADITPIRHVIDPSYIRKLLAALLTAR